ncbi:hypothetical protein C9439_01690 [archaeon SCG-AAA382B04]|nr:hypothetical protein C9439_01690 [archaeon SCG-AAA382B04]
MPSKIDDERIIKKIKPHPFSFGKLYLIFIYISAIGVFHILFKENLVSFFQGLPLVSVFSSQIPLVTWWLLLIIPGVVVALLRISWKWLLLFVGIAASLTGFRFYLGVDFGGMNLALIGIGLIGLALSDVYRISHKFYITNYRLITEIGFLKNEKRTLLYSKINDLVFQKPPLGKIFNFGTIIPITGSGFGLGEDFSMAGAGVGGSAEEGKASVGGGIGFGGGKTIQNPRARSPYVLFGVTNPQDLYDEIIGYMHSMEEGHHLQKISNDIEELLAKGEDESEIQGSEDN